LVYVNTTNRIFYDINSVELDRIKLNIKEKEAEKRKQTKTNEIF